MKHRVVFEWLRERSALRLSRWSSSALALALSAAFVGGWACAPRGERAGAASPAPLVASAAAGPLASALLAAPTDPSGAALQPRTLQEIDQQLARTVAEARAEAEPPAAADFPVAERMELSATMYCLRGEMRTGVRTRDGMAAGDPRVLPLGSVVRVAHPDGRPVGIFVIMDTGGAIRGNKLDIYVHSCPEAVRWGRRPVVAEVLQIGRATPGDLY